MKAVLDYDESGNEILYRNIPDAHLSHLEEFNELLPTTETSLASSKEYASKYDGNFIKFYLKPGTSEALEKIGLRVQEKL